MKTKLIYVIVTLVSLTALIFSGCAEAFQTSSSLPSSSQSSQSSSQSAMAGTLQVQVTDAPPADNIDAIWVTVDSVAVHVVSANATSTATATSATASNSAAQQEQEQEKGNSNNQNNNRNQNQTQQQAQTLAASPNQPNDASGWQTLSLSDAADMSPDMPGINFQLLDLQGTQLPLASGNFTAGKYTQIRMDISQVMIYFKDGTSQEAKLPSGELKFVSPFEIEPGQTTLMLVDFDALKSVNITGNGIIFKPVIKLTVNGPQQSGASAQQNSSTEQAQDLAITTQSVPDGTVGTLYFFPLAATGGSPAYTWSLIGGALPPNVNLSSQGVISGTPTTAASDLSFTVQVTDSASPLNHATQEFKITINPQ